MDMNSQIRDGVRLLEGIEEGTLAAAECYNIIESADCVTVSLIFKFLRSKYPPTRPDSSGVTSRLVELSGTYPSIVQKVKEGEQDMVYEWFEDSYAVSEFYPKPDEFVSLIVEKLES